VLVWTCLHHRELSCTWMWGQSYACTCLDKRILCWSGYVYTIGAWAASRGYLHHRGQSCTCTCLDKRILCWSGHVYTIGAWTYLHHRARAAPVMSGQKDSVLVWTCLHHGGLSCAWMWGQSYACTCLDKRILCWSGYVYTIGAWAAPGRHLHHKGQSCTCTCLDNRILCWSEHVYTIEAWAAPEHISITESFAASGCVFTTEAFAAPRRVNKTAAWAAGAGLDMSTQ
jgi:hypothetical protein